jgi:hypothetical protein
MILRSTVLLLSILGCSSFAPVPLSSFSSHRSTSVSSTAAAASKGKHENPIAAGLTAAALLVNLFTTSVPPAYASDAFGDIGGSSQLLAARSGGRAGGRAYRPAPAAVPRTTYRSSSTTVIQPMIAPPPIVVAPASPSIVVSPFGFGYSSPLSGFGLGYGLGAMNSAGDTIRDIRQESEIQQSRVELEQAKAKEAELEARLKLLEAAQVNK